MFTRSFYILVVIIVFTGLLSGCAEFKEAGRSIGHATRDAGVAIGHGTRDAAKSVAEGTERVVDAAVEEEANINTPYD